MQDLFVTVAMSMTLLLSACAAEPCEVSLPLAEPRAWTLVDSAQDPWSPEPGEEAYRCVEPDFGVETLDGDESLTLVTGRCNWATVAQALPRALVAGDRVRMRVFWFSQERFLGATAHIGLALENDIVLEHEVPLPSEGDLLETELVVARDYPVGTPVCFHIGNHGANTWNLLELSLLGEAPCE